MHRLQVTGSAFVLSADGCRYSLPLEKPSIGKDQDKSSDGIAAQPPIQMKRKSGYSTRVLLTHRLDVLHSGIAGLRNRLVATTEPVVPQETPAEMNLRECIES